MSFERRKVRIGRVIRDKTDKSVVVLFEWRRPHPLYKRPIRRSSKFNVHDEGNTAIIGDLVKIIESRPYSKTKRWRLVEVLEREEIAELQPEEIAIIEPSVVEDGPAEPDVVVAEAAEDDVVVPEAEAEPESEPEVEVVAEAAPEAEAEPESEPEVEVVAEAAPEAEASSGEPVVDVEASDKGSEEKDAQ
jgi:small subunit ribosomal protein S17